MWMFLGGKIVGIALACFTNLHSEIVNQMLRTRPHATAIPKTAQYSAIARTATSCCALTFFMLTITIKDPSQSQSYLTTNILSSTSERNVFLIKHKFRLFLVWKQACRVTVLPHCCSSSVFLRQSRHPRTSFRDQSVWYRFISDVVFYSFNNCVNVSVAVDGVSLQ